MSNFNCDHCNKPITEDDAGYYRTGCEHYPISIIERNKQAFVLDGFEFDESKYVIFKEYKK